MIPPQRQGVVQIGTLISEIVGHYRISLQYCLIVLLR